MIQIFYLFLFFLGLTLGSFLNSFIYSLETKKTFLNRRSHCPYCSHFLGFWDLLPVLSFIFLKGKCRYCKKSISFQYPLVEIFTALIFLTLFLKFKENPFDFLFFSFISLFLISIFVFDLKHYLIPDQVIHPAIVLTTFYNFYKFKYSFISLKTLFSFFPALFFLTIILISKEKWMGFGDFKLAILLGLILGWPQILVALFFSFVFGGFVSLFLVFTRKKNMKSEIPFAPFLISGTFISLFFGEKILNFYLNLFLI